MVRTIIERLEAKNYGCLTDVAIRLTPLHALVGPNDSGKSTILRAVREVLWSAADNPYCYGPPPGDKVIKPPEGNLIAHLSAPTTCPLTVRSFCPDPDVMCWSSRPPDPELPIAFDNPYGQHLSEVYAAISARYPSAFALLLDDVRRLFPSVSDLHISAAGRDGSAVSLMTTLHGGNPVPAEHMSKGLLLYLAYAALPYLAPVSVLLVENPENFLHPALIKEVMHILRKLSETTQVLITTYSPFVLNELEPEEVSIVTRSPEEGTKVTPIRETTDFEERFRVYSLGELWVSYADGVCEERLVS